MVKHGSALELGLALIQTKLGEAMGDPSFRVLRGTPREQKTNELERTDRQTKDRSAKVRTPRILNIPV